MVEWLCFFSVLLASLCPTSSSVLALVGLHPVAKLLLVARTAAILSTATCLRVTLRVPCLQLQALKQDLELSEATGRDLHTLLKWEKHEHKKVSELGSFWLWTCA